MKMAKSIKLQDDNYIDTSGIVHNKNKLSDILDGTILYQEENGSNENITLTESAENFKYIEVYYRNNDNFYASKKFYEPNNKKVILDVPYVSDGSDNVVFKYQHRLFENTNFKCVSYAELPCTAITNVKKYNYIYVTLVVGYK